MTYNSKLKKSVEYIINKIYGKPRLSRTRLSRIFAQLGQNLENG